MGGKSVVAGRFRSDPQRARENLKRGLLAAAQKRGEGDQRGVVTIEPPRGGTFWGQIHHGTRGSASKLGRGVGHGGEVTMTDQE